MEKIITPRIATNFKKRIATNVLVFVAIGFLFVGICGAKTANAASLYFSPSAGAQTVGNTLSTNVYVGSSDQVMNAASGVISFPKDKLEVVSLSKNNSIFSLWVQEPSFSNTTGIINFEGIVLNPGFSGASGKIVTINFKVKSAGLASLNFSSGSVLANDGKGTNILADLGSAQFNLSSPAPSEQVSEPSAPKATAQEPTINTPLAPKISSLTHPDPDKWYNNNKPKFTWQLPSGITAVKLLFDKYPSSQPAVLYAQPISEKQLDEVGDGIWYFHCQFKNASGWGKTGHFKFQIDTQPPEPFTIKIIDGKETDNSRPIILFDTVDTLSGIDYYKIKIGSSNFESLNNEEKQKGNPYTLVPQTPGKKTLLVQAYDKAGNYTIASEEITIIPLPAPNITEYPKTLTAGETLNIKGIAVSNSQVNIWLQKESEEAKQYEVKSEATGNFVFSFRKMEAGDYKLWAQAIDERGAQSELSHKISIEAKSPVVLKVLSKTFQYCSIIVGLIACLFLMLFIFWKAWRRIVRLKRVLKKETADVSLALKDSFDKIRKTMLNQIKTLEEAKTKRALTKEEEKIMKKMNEVLAQAEKTINKELNDINKKID